MHIQSVGPDGLIYGWDDEKDIPEDHRRLSDKEIDSHINPPLTESQIIQEFTAAVQSHMDEAARSRGYDDIRGAVTYADEASVPKFQSEGRAFRSWRSLCWEYCYEQFARVKGGDRSQPTASQLIDELPKLALP